MKVMTIKVKAKSIKSYLNFNNYLIEMFIDVILTYIIYYYNLKTKLKCIKFLQLLN